MLFHKYHRHYSAKQLNLLQAVSNSKQTILRLTNLKKNQNMVDILKYLDSKIDKERVFDQ